MAAGGRREQGGSVLRPAITVVRIGVVLSAFTVSASAQETPIAARAHDAARIVVATVTGTSARYERNEFGDELIVTYARLEVEEAMKGPRESITLGIEGGTVDGITLKVSDLPSISRGERGVFFLAVGRNGEFRLHKRGEGILKLDASDHVPGTVLTLNEIRRQIASAK
jgi:hypothetical protein